MSREDESGDSVQDGETGGSWTSREATAWSGQEVIRAVTRLTAVGKCSKICSNTT